MYNSFFPFYSSREPEPGLSRDQVGGRSPGSPGPRVPETEEALGRETGPTHNSDRLSR